MPNTKPPKTLLCRLAAILLLSSSLTPAPFAVLQARAETPDETAAFKAYANSTYGFCDASVLSKLWNVSLEQAKITLGAKILAHAEAIIDRTLGSAYSRHRCEQSFNYEDASKVAALWSSAAG